MLDILGHVAEGSLAVGTLMVARGSNVGFFPRMIGGVLWMYTGYHLGMTSIWTWAGVFLLADAIGIARWINSERREEVDTRRVCRTGEGEG